MAPVLSINQILLFSTDVLKYSALIEAFREKNISVRSLNDPTFQGPVNPSDPDLILFDPPHEEAVHAAFHSDSSLCRIPILEHTSGMEDLRHTYPFFVIWSWDSQKLSILTDRLIHISRSFREKEIKVPEKGEKDVTAVKLNILNDLLLSLDEHLRLSDALTVAAKYFDTLVHYDLLFFYSLWSDNIILLNGEGVSPRLKDAIHILSKMFVTEKSPDMINMIPDFKYSDSEDPVRDEKVRDSLLFSFPSSGRFNGIIGFISYEKNVYAESDRRIFEALTRQIETILRHIESIVRKKQEQQILTIFDQINDAVAIVDLNRNQAYINHYFQHLKTAFLNSVF